ncbi:MAG: hypothetical protein BWY17_05026 [Deltaproteobacteria bacterium ADurb.Bin207]|nr:MAG: hypothetical protein BWY17_05026 [Deltaproteobacteria bacterium ADurb.Bin207]
MPAGFARYLGAGPSQRKRFSQSSSQAWARASATAYSTLEGAGLQRQDPGTETQTQRFSRWIGAQRLCFRTAMGLVHQQRVLDLDVELRTHEQSALMRVVCVPFVGEDRYYLT